MTCIVAFKTELGSCVIAGDFMASNGHNFNKVKSPKIFAKSEHCMVGYTTSFRMGQILEHYWVLPPRCEDISTDTYINVDVVESLRSVFTAYGYGSRDGLEDIGGNFILIYKDRIFEVQSNYSVLEYDTDIVAIGSGRDAALGAMHSLLPIKGEVYEEIETLLTTIFRSVNKVTSSVSDDYMYHIMED